MLAAVGLVLMGVALLAMPRAIQAGDAGEMATVMLRGGVPHPSGYPWMRALGLFARAFAGVGVPSATAAALPCALLGIVGWLLVLHVVARWFCPIAGAIAVLVAATSAPVVVHGCDAEVWGPLVAFIGLALWVASSRTPSALRMGIAIGLAASHHLSAVLLVPIAIAAV